MPQYILEDSVKRRKRCNIIIAQPRRIAAQSNAERVTTERDLMPATLVGSQVFAAIVIANDAHCAAISCSHIFDRLVLMKEQISATIHESFSVQRAFCWKSLSDQPKQLPLL